jgi:2-polyprenyl-6-hydroxyphenyl methylase/3-demethylubiquinone-9 3-methyltransferase
MRQARLGLRKLLDSKIAGARFLDIGCGSGLSLLAALQLGAELAHGIDVDPDSVTATRSLLTKFGPPERWSVECADALSFSTAPFDIVYSWGVLHHTGAMREAIRSAAQLVKPGGLFAFALYRRTRMCWFWRKEKRWYSAASPREQRAAKNVYIALMRLAFRVTGRNFESYVANYKSSRGMDFSHDVHDWLGGYPYESITQPEVHEIMRELGFWHVRSFVRPMTIGLFGSGCDEYVYCRSITTPA